MKCTAVFFFAFAAVTSAFSPATPRVLAKARAAPVMRAEAPKFSPAALVAAVPAVLASTPAFADSTDLISQVPMATSLEVTFAAYLAVLLGTLLPTLFLIVLYLNSEARKIGNFKEEDPF
mmetsp:Transcript_25419/g.57094  ORF Transcript_25419/g.57094 Transcript_25419/m.57094 type:complete len:120 (+) Transcript_25419:60-419(+)|eukprot:CAMPEP_0172581900 /NCGR_PEP_ID=MMETSP1068-20121228/1283_1 /TAXON_ID=35684 /ORGANISM="Pseudopedinella elastica, Strain CCMP716" /LENGTH=119 /DNA_ID=CAMNT_0013375055 /DNA_START=59 /DNA_END=418 /DNA_ORIENTATION=+